MILLIAPQMILSLAPKLTLSIAPESCLAGQVVKYSAAAGQRGLLSHVDGGDLSFMIALSESSEYVGGGTHFEALPGLPFAAPTDTALMPAATHTWRTLLRAARVIQSQSQSVICHTLFSTHHHLTPELLPLTPPLSLQAHST